MRYSLPCLSFVLGFSPGLCAHGQQPTQLSALLDRLSADSELLQTALPRFECTEAVVTSRTHKGKQKERVSFTATLRAQPSDGLDSGETYQVKTLNGKPTDDPEVLLPFYIRGGFDSVLLTFARTQRACYSFTLAPGAPGSPTRIDFAATPLAASMPHCGHAEGLRGFVRLDAQGNPTHIERTLPLELADRYRLTPFAAVDLAPVELNGRTYQLSTHLVSNWPHMDDLYNFEARYSGCHEFAATIRLLPGSTVVPETDAPK